MHQEVPLNRQCYDDNRDKIVAHVKQYYQDHNSCTTHAAQQHASSSGHHVHQEVPLDRQCYDDNRDKIVAHVKQYYQDHKAEQHASLDAVIECEGGLTSTRSHMPRHKRWAECSISGNHQHRQC